MKLIAHQHARTVSVHPCSGSLVVPRSAYGGGASSRKGHSSAGRQCPHERWQVRGTCRQQATQTKPTYAHKQGHKLAGWSEPLLLHRMVHLLHAIFMPVVSCILSQQHAPRDSKRQNPHALHASKSPAHPKSIVDIFTGRHRRLIC